MWLSSSVVSACMVYERSWVRVPVGPCAFFLACDTIVRIDILSISNLSPNKVQRLLFKMVPNMNGLVNRIRLLKNWTMLRAFQMPLVVLFVAKILKID